jgi:hypothetical protein
MNFETRMKNLSKITPKMVAITWVTDYAKLAEIDDIKFFYSYVEPY